MNDCIFILVLHTSCNDVFISFRFVSLSLLFIALVLFDQLYCYISNCAEESLFHPLVVILLFSALCELSFAFYGVLEALNVKISCAMNVLCNLQPTGIYLEHAVYEYQENQHSHNLSKSGTNF